MNATPVTAQAETRTIDGHGEMTFQQYRRAVSVEIIGRLGVSLDDLVDYDLWSDWEAGASPKEAAQEAALNESDSMCGMFDELMEDLFED